MKTFEETIQQKRLVRKKRRIKSKQLSKEFEQKINQILLNSTKGSNQFI